MVARLISAGAVVAFGLAVCDAQTPGRDGPAASRPAGGSISGTVVNSVTLAAVARAVIELSGAEMPVTRYSLTDVTGQFRFAGVPAGRFTVSAKKPGYVSSTFGAKRAAGAGTPLAVAAGQQVANVNIRMAPGSVLAGTVIDQFGRPASGMLVRAWRYSTLESTGERLPMAPEGIRASAISDDEGRYRLFGLSPGDYIVSAVSPKDDAGIAARPLTDAEIKLALELLAAPRIAAPTRTTGRGAMRRSPPAFGNTPMYNSSADAVSDATRITIATAEERNGVDVFLRVAQTGTVIGNVSGGTRGGGAVRLVDKASLFERTVRWAPSDGAFLFPGVPPGTYTLLATADNSSARGRAEVFVAGQDVTTVVYLQAGAEVSGRVVLDASAAGRTPPSVRVSLNGASRSEWPARDSRSQSDGSFAFPAVPTGAYRMEVVPPPGWRAISALFDGVDLLDKPLAVRPGDAMTGLVIALTDVRSDVSGVLTGQDGRGLADDTIIIFAADSQFWTPMSRRTVATRPGTDGRFSIRDLPAGDYILAAVSDVEPGQWRDPQFLSELAPYGVKISLTDGEKKVQNLKINGGYSTR